MKKKKILVLTATLGVLTGATSCDDLIEQILGPEETPKPTELALALERETVDASYLQIPVTVHCNKDWSAKLENPDWGRIIQLEKADNFDGTLILDLGFNTGAEARTNTLIITSSDRQEQKSFRQGGTDELFTPVAVQFRGTGADTLRFTPRLDWTASVDPSCSDWLEIKDAQGKAGVPAALHIQPKEPFVDLGSRSGEIILVFDGQYTCHFPVSQYQKDVVLLDTESVSMDFTEQVFTVETDCNVDFSVNCSASWLHEKMQPRPRALNHSTTSFEAEENPSHLARSASVSFIGNGADGAKVETVLTITQEARHPLLWNVLPGIYGFNGKDVVYQPYHWQISRTRLPGGSCRYALMNPDGPDVYVIEGLPEGLEKGQQVSLAVLHYAAQDTPSLRQEYACTVLYKNDTRLWLLAQDGTGFVL